MKKRKIALGIIALAVLVFLFFIIRLFTSHSKATDFAELDLGNKYLDEMEYDKALAAFESVLDIDPKNVEAYLGIVEVYIRQKDYDKALEIAKEGFEKTGDERLNEKINMIQSGNIKTSDNRTMKRTCYDANGQILYYHDFTYKKDTRDHVVEAFTGDGVKINQAEVVYGESVNIRLRDYSYGTEDGILYQETNEYNNDLRIKQTSYDSDGVTVRAVLQYEYDREGRCIKETVTDAQGHVTERENQYNTEGQKVRFDSYNDGQLTYYSTFTYYEDGRQKTQEMYGADGTMTSYTEYMYNDAGKSTGSRSYDGSGNLLHETKYN